MSNLYIIKCGWGETKARLQYVHEGVYYWKATNGFKFITHSLKDANQVPSTTIKPKDNPIGEFIPC